MDTRKCCASRQIFSREAAMRCPSRASLSSPIRHLVPVAQIPMHSFKISKSTFGLPKEGLECLVANSNIFIEIFFKVQDETRRWRDQQTTFRLVAWCRKQSQLPKRRVFNRNVQIMRQSFAAKKVVFLCARQAEANVRRCTAGLLSVHATCWFQGGNSSERSVWENQ